MAKEQTEEAKSAGPVDVEAVRKKLACDPPFSDAYLVGYFHVIVPALLARVEELEDALKAISEVEDSLRYIIEQRTSASIPWSEAAGRVFAIARKCRGAE